ncbi:basic proline-rich protein-like [Canis lupus familiaris]|uniref:basic proline-rich protein-like n=1 Tax=Canis lupus familiaris TaxID=9615 RepID=UPI0018F6DB87|nr:basic proline-rich protein-like [Canis lupus familiaris]
MAAGEGGERASTPAARGAQTESEGAAAGRSVILARQGPRQVCAAPSRPRRPGARLTAARLRPPPGPRGEVSLPPAAAAAPGLGRVGGRRREPEPGPVTSGGKQKPGEDERARRASPPRGGAPRARERLPEGAPAPRAGGARWGRRGWAGGGRRARSRPPRRRSPRGAAAGPGTRAYRGPRGGAAARGPRPAKEGIRLPGRCGRPPHPCGHGAGTCRRGCSSASSLAASAARRSAPAPPPSRPSARWTPPPETGSAREPARIPRAAPGAVPPPPAAGPAVHRAPGLSIRPQKARGLSLRPSGLVAARRPCD